MIQRLVIWPCVFVSCIAFVQTAKAQEADPMNVSATSINRANELVREGKFDEAIVAYQQVQPTKDDRETLTYNLAVAQYRRGNLDVAKQSFAESASASNETIAANSRFNLGNCFYSEALELADENPSAAVDTLDEAIANYRSSLSINPSDVDARANIELAAKLRKELQKRKEQQQNSEQQNSEQQNSEQQNSEQQNSERQNSEQQNSEQQDSEQQNSEQQNSEQQNSEQQNSEQQDSEQQNSEQQDSEQQNSEQQNSEQQNSEQQNSEQQNSEQQNSEQQNSEQQNSEQQNSEQQNSEQQNSEQQNSEQQNSDSRPQEPEPSSRSNDDSKVTQDKEAGMNDQNEQQSPDGELTSANQQDSEREANEQTEPQPVVDQEGRMTKEEAMKLLQSVRDRDMLRRLRQAQADRQRQKPVEKDW
jgi:Ca-activated chloride channel homolog